MRSLVIALILVGCGAAPQPASVTVAPDPPPAPETRAVAVPEPTPVPTPEAPPAASPEPQPAPAPVANPPVHVVAAPPFAQRLARGPSPVRSARVVAVSDAPNTITNVDAWHTANGVIASQVRGDTSSGPALQGVGQAAFTFVHADHSVVVYSDRFGRNPVVAVRDAQTQQLTAALDLRAWVLPARFARGYTDLELQYAQAVGDVLYVNFAHRTYASSSSGRNAYLSAIDLRTGRLLWQTRALVANVQRFAIVGDVIVTGYGFTAEKDYLYVVDRATGRILHRTRLASGPSHVVAQQNRILVRCYDRDYVFDLQVR